LVADDVRAVISASGTRPGVTISPDSNRSGTNALLMRPPDAIPFLFGADSFEAHCAVTRERDLNLQVFKQLHVGFDLDTTGDLEDLSRKEES
jgi:2-phospho-L-lactate guanylyltransferase